MPERKSPRDVKLVTSKIKKKSDQKKSRLKIKRKVLKMIAVMEQHQTAPGDSANCNVDDFLNTGRTGRRNALPDILSDHAMVTTGDLPARLQSLSASDEPSTSGTQDAGHSQQQPVSSDNSAS